MKLKQYFDQQKTQGLTDMQKMKVYQDFLVKSKKSFLYSKASFYRKVGAYFTFIILLFLSFYIPYINNVGENNTLPNYTKVGTGFIVQQKPEIKESLTASAADNIGTILQTRGNFKIFKDGVEIDTRSISEGDEVLLMDKAELTFDVNSGARAFILGPAKFSLEYIGKREGQNSYMINLIYGQYFEIRANNQIDSNVVIKTDDFEIEPQYVKESMDIKITSQGDKKIVENNGGDIVVKKVVNNKKTYSSVKTNQKVEIDEEVKLLAEVKQIKSDIKEKQVQSTYQITGTDSGLVKNTQEVVENVKKILDEEEMEQLKTILYPSFMMNEIESLTTSYLAGNTDSFELSYNKVLSRLTKIYKLFGFKLDSEILKYTIQGNKLAMDNLFIVTDQLLAKIQNNYYLPSQYTKRIKTLLAWLIILKEKEFEMLDEDITFEQVIQELELQDYDKDLIIK